MASRLKLDEVFYSIQGEGVFQGEPTLFIRFHGCNLACSYCDTKYANVGKPKRVVTPIVLVRELKKEYNLTKVKHICITGGEPLTQSDGLEELIGLLQTFNLIITVETNGSLIPSISLRNLARWVVDFKLPSSGSYPSFNTKWYNILYIFDQLKFVASDQEDLTITYKIIEHLRKVSIHRPTILVSPKFNKDKLDKSFCIECIDFCKINNCRFSLQIHKVVWGTKKGV